MKNDIICNLEPLIAQGLVRFSRKHQQLIQQLTQFTLAKNDDGPDALEVSMNIALKPVPFVVVIGVYYL